MPNCQPQFSVAKKGWAKRLLHLVQDLRPSATKLKVNVTALTMAELGATRQKQNQSTIFPMQPRGLASERLRTMYSYLRLTNGI
jgi:hypothetical protein